MRNVLARMLTPLRRPSVWVALVAGLAAGLLAWWWLPPAPRLVVPTEDFRDYNANQRVYFSPDGNVLALHASKMETWITIVGSYTIFDASDGRVLFRIPYRHDMVRDRGLPDVSAAFTPDGRYFTLYSRGALRRWDTATGAEAPPIQVYAPPEGDVPPDWGRMVTDARGAPYLRVRRDGVCRYLELPTGHERGRFALGEYHLYREAPGGQLLHCEDAVQLREVPTGRLLAEVPWPREKLVSDWAATADGGLMVARVWDGAAVHVWDVRSGADWTLSLPGEQLLALSPDGSLLALRARPAPEPRPWSDRLYEFLRLTREGPQVVVDFYDPGTGEWQSQLPDARWARFSPDGTTLAVASSREPTVRLYDVPFRAPAGATLLAALAAALPALALVEVIAWRRRRGRQPGRVERPAAPDDPERSRATPPVSPEG